MALFQKRTRRANKSKMTSRKPKTVSRIKSAFTKQMIRRDIHYFRRFNRSNVFAPLLGGASIFTAFEYNLGYLPNVSEFSNLFDFYRINAVVHKFTLVTSPEAQASNAAAYPRLYYVRDYDDAVAPSGVDDIVQHSKVRSVVMRPGIPISVKLRPAVNKLVFGGVTSGYTPAWKSWIDMSRTDISHFGLKLAITNFNNTNYNITQEVIFYFSCKDTR